MFMSMIPTGIKRITRYIYGTTRLGDDKIPHKERIKIAHAAMDAGVWFHTSRMYGNALEVLGEAFCRRTVESTKAYH